MAYPYPASTVFSGPVGDPKPASSTKPNGSGNGNSADYGEVLETLLVLDYRYARFALDPKTGLFSVVKYVDILLISW